MDTLEYFIKAHTWRDRQYSVSKREAFNALMPYLDRDSLRQLVRYRRAFAALNRRYYAHFDAVHNGGYEAHWAALQQAKQEKAELIMQAREWWWNRFEGKTKQKALF